MKRNVLITMISVLAVLLSAPFSASAAAGHTVSIASSTNVSCNGGNDGTATAAVSGGTGPFGYEWTPGNILGAIATGLSAGTYTVTVTDSSDMSTAITTVTIMQPAALTVSLTANDATCFGACNGSISSIASGGVSPYTYIWSPGPMQTTSSITGLCAGTYTLVITDANGCTAIASATISEPPQLQVNPSVTSASCFNACDGAAGTNPTGGTPPYTYSWLPGGQTTQNISGVCAGTYTVVITDAIGCSASASITIGEPAQLVLTAGAIDETCAGSNDGIVNSMASGGIPPYSYSWSPSGATTQSVSGLAPGNYTVTVTDNSGCVSTAMATVAPASLLIIMPSSVQACFSSCDGSLSAAVSGGNGPYTYLWQPGNMNTPTINNVCPGTYTITVADINGCVATGNVTVSSGASMAPVATATPPQICLGNTSQLQVNATGAMAYSWIPNVALNNPTIANPVSSPTATTNYNVVVTDVNGCSEMAAVTVTVVPNPTVTITSTQTCNPTLTTLTANPVGNPPFVYTWSTAQTPQSIIVTTAGPYSVFIQDANGCISQTANYIVVDSCGWVWPGDADEDLVVNNNDVLAIGLGYGSTGPVRANASIAWTGQPAQDWSNTLPNGINLKYTDCNGDGVIDNADTLAVTQNYGLTHTYRLMESVHSLSDPNLYLVASMDSAGPETAVNIDIMLGELSMPIDSIYGLAYTLTFDPSLIDPNASHISYAGSWMGTVGTDMIPFSKHFHSSGFIDAAVTRIDHINRSGHGKIATFRIVTTDNLSGIVPLNVGISNVTALTAKMAMLSFNTSGDTIVLDSSLTTGITYHQMQKLISVYPNPANSSVTFEMPANTVSEMIVSDMTGRVIMRIAQPSPLTRLDLSRLETGMYQVTMRTSQGNINKKLQVIR